MMIRPLLLSFGSLARGPILRLPVFNFLESPLQASISHLLTILIPNSILLGDDAAGRKRSRIVFPAMGSSPSQEVQAHGLLFPSDSSIACWIYNVVGYPPESTVFSPSRRILTAL